MIEKELIFEYKLNYLFLFHITIDNNSQILSIFEDLRDYKQGNWKNNKRKDIIQFYLNDIPDDLLTLISIFIKNNVVPLKIKIKILENNDSNIKLKVKVNLLNKLLNVITKIINFTLYCDIIKIDDNNTKVIIKYVIKSILSQELIQNIDNYIDTKLNNKFISRFDNYLKKLDISINN
jgi:hypothetical protein